MGAPRPRADLGTQYLNSQTVVVEVAKTVGLSLEDFHFVVKAFGDPVVAGEAPHGSDVGNPGGECVAESDAKQPRREPLALGSCTVPFQQQITEPLLEPVDDF